MTIDKVSKNVVAFRGNEDGSSGGYFTPVVGGAIVGGGVAGLWKGFNVGKVDKIPNKDEFSKQMATVTDLTDAEKAAVKTIEDSYTTNPVEAPKTDATDAKPSEEPKANADAEVKTGAKSEKPKSLVAERSIDDVFGKGKEGKTEIEPSKLYEMFGTSANRETVDGIRSKLGQELQATKGHIEHDKTQAARVNAYIQRLEQANAARQELADLKKSKLDSVANENKELDKEIKKIDDDIEAKKAAVKEAEHPTAKDAKPASPEEITRLKKELATAEANAVPKKAELKKTAEATIARIEKNAAPKIQEKMNKLSALDESVAKLKGTIGLMDRGGKKAHTRDPKAIIGFEPTTETIQKAYREKGLVTYTIPGKTTPEGKVIPARTIVGSEIEKLTEAEYNTRAQDEIKKLRKENPKEVYELATEKAKLKKDADVVRKVNQEVATKIEALKAKEKVKLQQAHLTELKQAAEGRIVHNQRRLTRLQSQIEEVNAYTNLVETANKGKQKITRAQVEEVQGKISSKAKAALQELGEAAPKSAAEGAKNGVEDALKTLRKKLPKDFKGINWKGLGWGAAGGAVLFALGKGLFFSGKSEE